MRAAFFGFLCLAGFSTAAVAEENWHAPMVLADASAVHESDARVITTADVERAVKDYLETHGVAEHVRITLTSNANPMLFQSQNPITLVLHDVRITDGSALWQAQAYAVGDGKTLSVVPVSGRFEIMRYVPVLKQQITEGNAITKDDLMYVLMPERQLRKDVVTNTEDIVGKTPRRIISARRSIRLNELTTPRLISKGKGVEMRYTTAYMSIIGRGTALENGSLGETVRIKNVDSERTISARVVGENLVEVNLAAPVETAQNYNDKNNRSIQ